MYSLKEAWLRMYGTEPIGNWDGKIYCKELNADDTFRTNETRGYMTAYAFTLVREGWLTILYNGRKMTLCPNDLYIYSPGLAVTVLDASDDYHSIALLADEGFVIESPTVHDLVHIAYQPLVQLHEPKLLLPDDYARHLAGQMHEIIGYLHSDHMYKGQILNMLYAVLMLDLQDIQGKVIPHTSIPSRIEAIFIDFIRLLPNHFVQHHDIPFYADQLNISTVYLSRVVKQVTGHTVIDYINKFLIMEASFLLTTTQLSISQVASQLQFADTASFSKFFLRITGMTPTQFKEQA
ncbi:MAG: helix-turn-helix domain-containing protein [Prevotella sp.]|nr:helix-turn-helix domain-containing protein [Prevotella sp.]